MTEDGRSLIARLFEEFTQAMTAEHGYGTGMHYPSCHMRMCTGCLPDVEPPDRKGFDVSIFRKDVR